MVFSYDEAKVAAAVEEARALPGIGYVLSLIHIFEEAIQVDGMIGAHARGLGHVLAQALGVVGDHQDVYKRQIIVCSIENLDPMGVHTGDSITVAPAQTPVSYTHLDVYKRQGWNQPHVPCFRHVGGVD